jgi:arylsulfatase
MEHTTPITFPEDETFDIGQDTRTGVAMIEYRYDVPFKFTGKINNLTFNLGPQQLTAEEREQLPAIAKRVALAKD